MALRRMRPWFLLEYAALLAAVVALSLGLSHCSGGSTTSTTVTTTTTLPAGLGGSDYGWYYLASPCNREPYGVVYNYNAATATIAAG